MNRLVEVRLHKRQGDVLVIELWADRGDHTGIEGSMTLSRLQKKGAEMAPGEVTTVLQADVGDDDTEKGTW